MIQGTREEIVRVFLTQNRKEDRLMKKLIAMLMVGGVLAVSTVGCGPAASTAPTVTPKSGTTEVKDKADIKDKADVKDTSTVKDKSEVKDSATVTPKDNK